MLAEVRSRGGRVPFLLLAPFCSDRARAQIERLAPAAVLDDPLDATRLADLARALILDDDSQRSAL